MAQIEMKMLRLIENLEGATSKLSRIRMVLCQADRGEVDMSNRFFRKYRQLLYKVRKTEGISDEDLALCTRLLMRLSAKDPKHQASLKRREEKQAEARARLKLAHDESLTKPATPGPSALDGISEDFLAKFERKKDGPAT